METKFSTVRASLLGLVLLATACVKPPDPPIKNPGGGGGGGGDNPGKCFGLAKGTIEACPTNPNMWFINATYFPLSSLSAPPAKLYLPDVIPAALKVNGQTVSFEYTELTDSVALNCWQCGTPPVPYAKKIIVCSMKKDSSVIIAMKPNIYLYPTKDTKVDVRLNYQGKLLAAYPDYDTKLQGWSVCAKKDGTLENLADKQEYQYLFWEGVPTIPYNFNMNEGFCVKGSETKDFLQHVLPKLGLIPKEYNEMIVYWLPQMINNPYNLIHFATSDYTKSAPLSIKPQPDHLIRVFMAYQPSNIFVKTNEPTLLTPKREGFTVVEWGGAKVPVNVNPSSIKL